MIKNGPKYKTYIILHALLNDEDEEDEDDEGDDKGTE